MPGGYSDGSGSSLPAKCLPHALAEEGGREEGREGGGEVSAAVVEHVVPDEGERVKLRGKVVVVSPHCC